MVKVALVGAPHDANSSFLRGPAEAPDIIRRVLQGDSGNAYSESMRDVLSDLQDLGNFSIAQTKEGVMELRPAMARVLSQGFRVLSLGGDHAVTHPLALAVADSVGPIDILHFDAHGDLYPDFDGNPYSHASPFARLLESGCVGRLVQLGIRTLTPEQQAVVAQYGVETYQWRGELPPDLNLTFEKPLYISVDIDALDPAFAPGVSHHEPGGMSVRDILGVLDAVHANVVAADIVEYNPRRDLHEMTAAVCAKLAKALLDLLRR
ncbi:MAG: arginase family protein [Pseudomonadota bacterium]